MTVLERAYFLSWGKANFGPCHNIREEIEVITGHHGGEWVTPKDDRNRLMSWTEVLEMILKKKIVGKQNDFKEE